jgi:hypothetical protein
MNKEFAPHKQSLELKELGFDEPCFGKFIKSKFQYNSLGDPKNYNNGSYGVKIISAPTFSQAFRFFREKHKLYGSYGQTNDNREEVNGFVIGNFINGMRNRLFADWEVGTYEESELACLVKLISIVKEQNK